MPVIWDRILQIGAAPGTGNFTPASTPTQYKPLSTIPSSTDFDYVIEGIDSSGQRTAFWEQGVGQLVGGDLVRTDLGVTDGSSGPGVRVNFPSTGGAQVRVMNAATAEALRKAALDALRATGVDTLTASAGTLTVPMSTGNFRKKADLSSNTTVQLSALADGGRVSLTLKNVSAGVITLTWDTGMVVVGAALPLTLAAGKTVRFVADMTGTALTGVVCGASVQS